jgi:hypothetical protein
MFDVRQRLAPSYAVLGFQSTRDVASLPFQISPTFIGSRSRPATPTRIPLAGVLVRDAGFAKACTRNLMLLLNGTCLPHADGFTEC